MYVYFTKFSRICIFVVILGRILLVQLIEANNSLVVLEPKLVAWKTENTETDKTTDWGEKRTKSA